MKASARRAALANAHFNVQAAGRARVQAHSQALAKKGPRAASASAARAASASDARAASASDARAAEAAASDRALVLLWFGSCETTLQIDFAASTPPEAKSGS